MSNQNTPSISIIVPMYNCEEYVEELLDSFSKQSFTDFEVICVNDGSTDNTLDRIKECCTKDHRFSYISQSNAGAGAARNAGMEIAKGKYIMFLDADDEYGADLLKEMHLAAEYQQADIVICQFSMTDMLRGTEDKDIGLYNELKKGGCFAPQDISNLLNATNPGPINKMYLLSFLKRINVRYKNTKIAQDLTFTFSALPLADRIVTIPKNLITVRSGFNTDSISSNRKHNRMEALSAIRLLYSWLKEHQLEDKYEESYLQRCKVTVMWETNFQCNEDYVQESANMILNEEPWSHLPYKTRMSYWNFNIDNMADVIEKLQTEIKNNGANKTLMARLESATNKYKSAEALLRLLKEDTPKISIVVPIYNSEDYIEDLFTNMSNQTFKDFELICVNDGSTDNTLSKLKELCSKDRRFKYITKENGGAGSARNVGIDAASGKYMMFLDADDEHYPTFLEEMYNAAEENGVDEVFCLYEEYDYKFNIDKHDQGFNTKLLPHNTPIPSNSLDHLYGCVSWAPWNVLYKKELIDKYKLRFSTTKVANDVFFIYAYASITKSILGLHQELLRIRKYYNQESITSRRWQHTEDIVSVLSELYAWLEKNNLTDTLGETCRKLFNGTVIYNSSFPYNIKYIESMAKCICTSPMWQGVDDKTFYENYWKIHDTNSFLPVLAKLKEGKENRLTNAQRLSNQLLAVNGIEKIAYEKYGRILNPNNIYNKLIALKNENDKLKLSETKSKEIIKSTEAKLKKTEKKLANVRNSKTFKTGYYTTWLPRKIYHGIKDVGKQTKNTHSIKISVIIPVWNVENYIKRCLDSLINQTFKDLEFIFIDDLGTDNSIKIVAEYQKRDSRIKIIHNPSNMGPGPSRNKGIELAKGEYLSFIDPDDWISLDWYEVLYREAQKNKVDIVKGNVQLVDDSGRDITPETYNYTNEKVKERMKSKLPLYRFLNAAHWSMLFSKRLFRDKTIRYGDMLAGEDSLFLLRVFLTEPSIAFCDNVFYYYFIRPDSLSGPNSFGKSMNLLKSLEGRIRHMKLIGFKDEYYEYLKFFVQWLLQTFKQYWQGNETEKIEDVKTYVTTLENVVHLLDDPSRVLDELPQYKELKDLIGST